MSWAFFIDESGQDRRASPYEVLAALAVEDRRIWPLIRQMSDAQDHHFGMRLFEAYGREAKAQKLLNAKVFRLAAQLPPMPPDDRRRLACELLEDGTRASKERLTALAQAKLAYVRFVLSLAAAHDAVAFATIVPRAAPRPPQADALRKDYAYLFERMFYFLNGAPGDPMGYMVFDELDRSACHLLLGQVSSYFIRTTNGRLRSRLIIPEPFFVHSDLTSRAARGPRRLHRKLGSSASDDERTGTTRTADSGRPDVAPAVQPQTGRRRNAVGFQGHQRPEARGWPELKKAMLPFPVTKPPAMNMVPPCASVKASA